MTTNLHAHIDTASSDCDGPMYREYVVSLNDDEVAMHDAAEANGGVNDFHDYEFKARVLSSQVSWHPLEESTVTLTQDGFTVHEPTDEGYRSSHVRWCEEDSCDPEAYSQRDVYAEMMGY